MDANVDTLLREAAGALRAGNAVAARRNAEVALQYAPDSPRALHLLGCIELQQGNLDAAQPLLWRAQAAAPNDPLVAYHLGQASLARKENLIAVQAFAKAVQLPQHAGDAYFKLGVGLGKLGHWQAAASALLLCARIATSDGSPLLALCEAAQRLLAQGLHAPPQPLPPGRLAGLISVIVCSIKAEKLAKLRANLDALLAGEDWELVHIADARSLCEGYNRGLDRSRGELLVFCHDDIALLNDDFATRLRAHLSVHDLIGVGGTTQVTGPAWGWSGPPHTYCWVAHPRPDGTPDMMLQGLTGPVVEGARLMDGVFLAGRRALFERLRFDADTFDGFHFYDQDFTWRAHLAGARCAIVMDLALFHDSAGKHDEAYWRYAERFAAKFPGVYTGAPHGVVRMGVLPLKTPQQIPPIQAWLAHWVSMSSIAARDTINAALNTLSANATDHSA